MNRLLLGLAALCWVACGVGNESVPTGDDVAATQDELRSGSCVPRRCGPALGMPTLQCSDGSVGGNTGRCLADTQNGTCHWEVRQCPAPTPVCQPGACGPALGLLSQICADGSVGGNTGKCLPAANGTCHWEIRSCPAPAVCPAGSCGPALGLLSQICADGSVGGNTGKCQPANGTCHWEIRACP